MLACLSLPLSRVAAGQVSFVFGGEARDCINALSLDSMSDTQPIVVEQLEALLALIEQAEFWVKWEVLCEIGPEWIGGGRFIQFYLALQPLADTPMHDRLKHALVESLGIPETSGDAVVSGEGTITRNGDVLEIEFEWSATVPYMYPHDGGHGAAVLMALS
jgi:hypothetical protein